MVVLLGAVTAYAVASSSASSKTISTSITPAPVTVHKSNVLAHTSSAEPTLNDLYALHDSLEEGTPLPSLFTYAGTSGSVVAVLTGVQINGQEQQVSVTVMDDIVDLDDAWLYLGTQLLFHASRANGSVIDRNGWAVATLSGFVPMQGTIDARVEWKGGTGTLQSATVNYTGI